MAQLSGHRSIVTWAAFTPTDDFVVSASFDGTIKLNDEYLDYAFVVENKQIGDTVTLTLRRDGQVKDVEVPLKGGSSS